MTSTEQKIAALQAAAARSREYAEIVPLFLAVYRYVSGREEHTGITIDMSRVSCAERTGNGFPLISLHEVKVARDHIVPFVLGVIEVLAAQGKEADADLHRIGAALADGILDPQALVLAIVERRRAPLDEAAATLNVPPPLLEYVFEIPLKTALERFSATLPQDGFDTWQEAFCPVCGARPGMAELVGEEGKRLLSCSACNFRWPFKRLKCPSCGCEDTARMSYFTAGEGATRVDTCSACSRYIKTRDARKGTDEVPLEVEDLVTIHLDLLATREGFERGK